MAAKWIKPTVTLVGLAIAIAFIAWPVIEGRYLEAVAVSGVVSVLAWFAQQSANAYLKRQSLDDFEKDGAENDAGEDDAPENAHSDIDEREKEGRQP